MLLNPLQRARAVHPPGTHRTGGLALSLPPLPCHPNQVSRLLGTVSSPQSTWHQIASLYQGFLPPRSYRLLSSCPYFNLQ